MKRKSFNPLDWKMSESQHRLYFELWGKACAHQGWDKLPTKDREQKRREVTAEVFGGEKSAKDINKTNEFDAIKAKFMELADIVQGARETIHPSIGEKRRLLNLIAEKKQLVALYREPENYFQKILKERHKIFRGVKTVEDLSAEPRRVYNPRSGKMENKPSELMQFIFTLTARINELRNEAGHTGHQMHTLANVKCECAKCIELIPLIISVWRNNRNALASLRNDYPAVVWNEAIVTAQELIDAEMSSHNSPACTV